MEGPRHRFNTADYYRLIGSGIIRPSFQTELLDGIVHDVLPTSPCHAGAVAWLSQFFTEQSKHHWLVATHTLLCLDEYSETRPDVMLLKPTPGNYTGRSPGPSDVFLLIEVADTMVRERRQTMLPVLSRAGIAEWWMVDLRELVLEIYREPHLAGYASVMPLRPGDQASLAAFPDVLIDFATLLKKG